MTKRLLDSLIKAFHDLFEEGFLSHQRVNNLNSPVIHNIQKEMELFELWFHRHQQTGDLALLNLLMFMHMHQTVKLFRLSINKCSQTITCYFNNYYNIMFFVTVYKQNEEKQGKRNFLQFWQVGLQKLIKV